MRISLYYRLTFMLFFLFQGIFAGQNIRDLSSYAVKPIVAATSFYVGHALMKHYQESRPVCKPIKTPDQPLDLTELDENASKEIKQLKKNITQPVENGKSHISQFFILQGAAGTGKTTISRKLPNFLELPGLEVPSYGMFWPKYNVLKEIEQQIAKNRDGKPTVVFFDEIDSFNPDDSFWKEIMEKNVIVVGTTNDKHWDPASAVSSSPRTTICIDYLTESLKKTIIINQMKRIQINKYITPEIVLNILSMRMTAAEIDMVFKKIVTHRAKAQEASHQNCVRGIYESMLFFNESKSIQSLDLSIISNTVQSGFKHISQEVTEKNAKALQKIVMSLNAINSRYIHQKFCLNFKEKITEDMTTVDKVIDEINKILGNIRAEKINSIIEICNHIYQCEITPKEVSDYQNTLATAAEKMNGKYGFDELVNIADFESKAMSSLLYYYQKDFNNKDKGSFLQQEKVEKRPESNKLKKMYIFACNKVKQSISLNIFSYISIGRLMKMYNVCSQIPIALIGLNLYLLYRLDFLPIK